MVLIVLHNTSFLRAESTNVMHCIIQNFSARRRYVAFLDSHSVGLQILFDFEYYYYYNYYTV